MPLAAVDDHFALLYVKLYAEAGVGECGMHRHWFAEAELDMLWVRAKMEAIVESTRQKRSQEKVRDC